MLRESIAQATFIDPERRLGSAAEFASRLRRLDDRKALRQAVQALERRNPVAKALNRLLCEDLIAAAHPALHGRVDITVADARTGAAAGIGARCAGLQPAALGSLHAAMQRSLNELSPSQEAVDAGQRAVVALSQSLDETPWATEEERRLALDELQSSHLLLALDLVQQSKLDEAAGVVDRIQARSTTAGPRFGPCRRSARLTLPAQGLRESSLQRRVSGGVLSCLG